MIIVVSSNHPMFHKVSRCFRYPQLHGHHSLDWKKTYLEITISRMDHHHIGTWLQNDWHQKWMENPNMPKFAVPKVVSQICRQLAVSSAEMNGNIWCLLAPSHLASKHTSQLEPVIGSEWNRLTEPTCQVPLVFYYQDKWECSIAIVQ